MYYIVCSIITQIPPPALSMYNICKLSVNKMYLYEHSNQRESEACGYLRGLITIIIILTENIKIKCQKEKKCITYEEKNVKNAGSCIYIFE